MPTVVHAVIVHGKSAGPVIPTLRKTGQIAVFDLLLSVIGLVVLVVLGSSAPSGVHPLYYFGLIFVGGAAFSLLLSGVIVARVRGRRPTFPAADARFFAGVRRGALAMGLCALVTAAFGVLILLTIADGRGSTPLGAGGLATALVLTSATVICAVLTWLVVRREVPKTWPPPAARAG
ncbi:hypothetical protein [Amycolatopsis sp. NPDC051903]|uniref:hypothetical protein n=1 Tax=Amycolatopsis sp. NPDC051903 TaxID=3363936 RepID=UPI0037B667C5